MLSILVPCYNNAALIEECLRELRWADELVVCDSFSTDGTLEIARRYADRVIQRRYDTSARQKNWAIPHCRHEWVLLVDSDERPEPGFAEEVRALLRAPAPGMDAWRVARKTYLLGRWTRTPDLWPDYQVRLFRRDLGRYQDRAVHAHMQVPGAVGTLRHALLHYSTPSLSKQIATLNRYTDYEVQELIKAGRRFRWRDLLLRPPAILLYKYVWRRGYASGFRGLFVSVYAAFYCFLTYAKLYEREHAP
jgi:glycosyltransferase involved in cell wall biosynthesis